MKPVSADSHSRNSGALFFALKTCNTVFAASQTFITIFVLIRVLPHNVYSSSLLVISIAIYVMATDLGYSGYVYFWLRQEFIQVRQIASWRHSSEVFTLYTVISAGAVLLVGGSIIAFADMALEYRLGLAAYFASAVAALPWMLLRRIAAAIDLHLEFEILEFWRRLCFLMLSLSMLLGLTLLGFSLLCMLVWFIAFWIAVRKLNQNSAKLRFARIPSAIVHARTNFPHIARTGTFTLLEFAILNFPYILISTQYRADSLVAFDVFFKLVRLGQFAYSVPAETLLPSQTLAYHTNDRRALIRNFFRMLALGFVALLPLSAIILIFGDELFALLLRRGDYVDLQLRITIIVMLSATLLQIPGGILFTGIGKYALLIKVTAATFALMSTLAGCVLWLHIGFHNFVTVYVLIYSVHALLFTACFVHILPAR
jgi:hypothetical protein